MTDLTQTDPSSSSPAKSHVTGELNVHPATPLRPHPTGELKPQPETLSRPHNTGELQFQPEQSIKPHHTGELKPVPETPSRSHVTGELKATAETPVRPHNTGKLRAPVETPSKPHHTGELVLPQHKTGDLPPLEGAVTAAEVTGAVQHAAHSSKPVSFKHYWYIACQSHELKANQAIQRTILDEWIALFRDENGKPVAFQDRCPHRNFKLSQGYVKDGLLQCPYHGWVFDKTAQVVAIPSESKNFKPLKSRCAKKFEVLELDDFVYVRLESHPDVQAPPFRMPHYKEKGYRTQRLFNVFKNNVTNCAENYVDVPHTVFVHDKIFRVSRDEKVEATVVRDQGTVMVDYRNETDNMGWFSFFLNPKKEKIVHRDFFHLPNVTSVEYVFSPGMEFYITSHSTPVNEQLTHVYTDLTYRFGVFTPFAGPIVRYQGQSVIDQDIAVLDTQMEVIAKYGERFSNSSADIVHVLIESLRNAVAKGQNPLELSPQSHDFEFWV